jgi:nitrogen fixation NifU-like protein
MLQDARVVEQKGQFRIVSMYSAKLLDHFEHPRNSGEVSKPDIVVELSNPACGDILKLSLRIETAHVAEIRFLAKGCVPAMACGSAVTELAWGKTLKEAAELRREDIVAAVGGLPEASGHAAHLAMDALRDALRRVIKR